MSFEHCGESVVLLVEDDCNILRTNRRILEREGFTVLCAETLREARLQLKACRPDVLVLDIMLPDGSGLDFCQQIRPEITAPVLFLTALDEQHEIIEGLVAGGNDYITKPYSVPEFLARVNAQLRLARMNRAERGKSLVRGPLALDLLTQRAYVNGTDLLLTQKEYTLLHLLARRVNEAISAGELYQEVWNMPMSGDNRALKKHLSTLRKKLEESGSGLTVAAVYGKGYMLE